jgi:hypothetical protein
VAKDTRRDRIWRIALTTDGFTKQYIEDQVDASSRTVHDVLKTMVDYRFLKQKHSTERSNRVRPVAIVLTLTLAQAQNRT